MKLFPKLLFELRLDVLIKYLLFGECEDGLLSFTRRMSYVIRFRSISAIPLVHVTLSADAVPS